MHPGSSILAVAARPAERGALQAIVSEFCRAVLGSDSHPRMEAEVLDAEIVLPTHLKFKKIQMYEKYPKGQSRGRHWKHLKQIIQAENYQNYSPSKPNYVNIESPPSMHPCNRICDITGFEAPYLDPRTKLRYANAEVFKIIRSLPNDYVQRYLALRNAAIVLK